MKNNFGSLAEPNLAAARQCFFLPWTIFFSSVFLLQPPFASVFSTLKTL